MSPLRRAFRGSGRRWLLALILGLSACATAAPPASGPQAAGSVGNGLPSKGGAARSVRGPGDGSAAPEAPRGAEAAEPTSYEGAQAPRDPAARAVLGEAEQLVAAGRFQEADAALRGLERSPDPEVPALALQLRGRAAAARGDALTAAYLYKQALEQGPPPAARYEINLALGELAYEAGDSTGAFRYYLEALARVPPETSFDSRVWLRLAEIAWYRYNDRELARYYLLQRQGPVEESPDGELLRRLVRRVSWVNVSAEALGVSDGNVSAVAADGDDLWVGTWNGGVVRYTLSNGQAEVFREGRTSLTANTVRAIEVTEGRVWVGTYQGLFVYSKLTGSWSEVAFGGGTPKRTEAIVAVGEQLFVGTLGDGLWRLRDGAWRRVAAGVLPGDFVNSLARAGRWLLIGTLNLGIVLLDLDDGRLVSFDEVNPGLNARNVILLLPVGEEELWIGTYGEGLYRWERGANRLRRYTRRQGEIGDDWVLSGVSAATGLYFGTFGAGVSLYREGTWRRLGLREGLGGLDITSVSYSPPYVVFGTLGSGITLLDESLALAGYPALQ